MSIGHKLINLREVRRPAVEAPHGRALDYALELLARPAIRTVPLAGGDTLLASGDASIEAVVDLQGLGLDRLELGTGAAVLQAGAMVTRATLAAAALSGETARSPVGLIAEGARRWSGNVQRNRATLGGALAVAASNDPLMIVLLVCDAQVEIRTLTGYRWLPLVQFIAGRKALLAEPALITQVRAPLPQEPEPATGYALADVARTPADAPIVIAAAAVALSRGRCIRARLALGGVAPEPIRLPGVEALLEGKALDLVLLTEAGRAAAAAVQPAGDFRGSTDYRRAMAGVLAERALRQAWDVARSA